MLTDPVYCFPGKGALWEFIPCAAATEEEGELTIEQALSCAFSRVGYQGQSSAWKAIAYQNDTLNAESSFSSFLRLANAQMKVSNAPSGKGMTQKLRNYRGIELSVPEEFAVDSHGAVTATFGSNPRVARVYGVMDLPTLGFKTATDALTFNRVLRYLIADLFLGAQGFPISDQMV